MYISGQRRKLLCTISQAGTEAVITSQNNPFSCNKDDSITGTPVAICFSSLWTALDEEITAHGSGVSVGSMKLLAKLRCTASRTCINLQKFLDGDRTNVLNYFSCRNC